MKREQIITFSVLGLLIIFVALVSSGKISLSPKVSATSTSSCQLGPLTDCINGCWQTYNDKIKDIEQAQQAHNEGCCGLADSCHWQKASEFYPGVCVTNLDSGGSCQDFRYTDCSKEFDTMPLYTKADEERRQCIKDCQNSFCGGTASS